MKISGFPAWLLWRTIYLMKMPGLDRKLRVGLDWLTALVFPPDLVQLRVQTSGNIANEHFEAGENVFEQGDVGDRMFVIRKGQVEVLHDGRQIAVQRDAISLSKGDFNKLPANFPELQAGLSTLAEARRTQREGGRRPVRVVEGAEPTSRIDVDQLVRG